ncbi:MAG: CHAT domain-containing protein [Saprospiraceae bacterium]|nr:CHAT domain-containing protein [Saprospiraceae bacterium]
MITLILTTVLALGSPVSDSMHILQDPQLRYQAAVDAFQEGDLNAALAHLKGVRALLREERNDTILSDYYKLYGTVLHFQLDEREALHYIDSALTLKIELFGNNHLEIAGVYNNLALVYNGLGEYTKSIGYLDLYRRIVEQHFGPKAQDLAKFYFNQSLNYRKTGDYDRAIDYLLKARDIRLQYVDSIHPYIADYYSYIGDNYVNKESWPDALDYYGRAEKIYTKTMDPGHHVYGMHKLHYGTAYLGAKEYDTAKKLFLESLQIRVANFGFFDPQVSFLYRNLAAVENALNEPDSVYYYLQKSLSSLGYFKDRQGFSEVHRYHYLLSTMADLADYFERVHRIDSSYFYWNENLRLIDHLRQSYKNDQAQVLLSASIVPVYEGLLEFGFAQFVKEPGDKWLNFVLSCAQSYRRNSLNLGILDREAIHFAGIPEIAQQREQNMKDSLLAIENRIRKLEDGSGSELMAVYHQQRLEWQDSFENYIKYLEKEYPDYYELKYSNAILTPGAWMRSIANAQLFIHYFYGEKDLYLLASDGKDFFMEKIPDLDLLEGMILDFREGISDPGADAGLNLIQQLGNQLYNKLLSKCFDKWPQTKELVILPDGLLRQIPFSCLTHRNIDGKYRWLIEDVKITYREQFLPSDKPTGSPGKLMAFAPSYEGYPVDTGITGDLAMNDLVRSGYFNLPGAQAEARTVSSIFSGALFLGKEATEAQFKQASDQADILHLSMHACVDHQNPMLSKLLFSHSGQEQEDDYLHAFELYNYRLRARLVVLSACNTGFGELSRGEGTMSLARAFSYAGVPSVVMSLWKIPDDASAAIMVDFYRLLKSGLDKSEALRQAKLRYFQKSIDPQTMHPFYWAGFVLNGSAEPISDASTKLLYAPIWIIAMLFLVSILIWRRKKYSTAGRSG